MSKANGREVQNVERLSIFELAGDLFGLEILSAREVIPLPRFTPLPNSGDIYLGVFNLRGDIFPLIDVSPILGLPPKANQSDDMVILLDKKDDFMVGMLIDKIHSVSTYAANDIELPRGRVKKSFEVFVKGIIQDGRRVIHILDLENLFRNKQLLAHF